MHVCMPACDCMCVHYIACKYIAFVCQFEKRMKVLANGGVSMPPHWVCVSVGVHMCGSLMCMCSSACMFMAPSSFTLLSSGGNVTPVPGIATSLDPGNSNDRNRRLLPLRHTRCLATGSPHTRPKPFQKASSSFIAIPAASLPLLLFLHCFLSQDVLFCNCGLFSLASPPPSPTSLVHQCVMAPDVFSGVGPAPLKQAVYPIWH